MNFTDATDATHIWGRSTWRAWAATALAVLLLSVQNASAQRGAPTAAAAPGTPQRPVTAAPNEPLERARAAVLHGQYAEAESLLRSLASRTNPNDAALELGLLLQQLGRKTEAQGWLNAIVDSTRASSAADFVRIGRAAQALGEFKLAEEALQSALARAPADATINLAWGWLFLQVHDNAGAAKSFQLATQSDPKLAAAHLGLAEA